MLVRKAFKFRIYPDDTQEELFRRTVGCCRLVYNLCLDQKMLERERSTPRKLSQFDQIKELTGLKAEFDFLREVPHHPLVQTVMDLHKAFTGFFEGRARFPTFRRKGENDSFRYPDPKQVKIEDERIFLPKAGWTKLVMHRTIAGKVKNVTVSVVAGDWFVSIQVEHEVAVVPVNRGVEIGIDLGGAQPIVQSDGTIVEMPRITKEERKQLATAQRTLARRTKGSRNRAKARLRVARLQAKYARRRKDARQERRRHRDRRPEGTGDDQNRQRHSRSSGDAGSETGKREPLPARCVAADDPDHAGVQGALVRLPDRRCRPGPHLT